MSTGKTQRTIIVAAKRRKPNNFFKRLHYFPSYLSKVKRWENFTFSPICVKAEAGGNGNPMHQRRTL